MKRYWNRAEQKSTENVLEASFTVEAALVLPMVAAIIFAIIYMMFYLYDRVTIGSVLHRYAWQAAEEKSLGMSDRERSQLKEQLFEEVSGSSILTGSAEVSLEDSIFEIRMSVHADASIPHKIRELTGIHEEAREEVRAAVLRMAERTRISDIIWNIGEHAAK